MLEGKLAKAIKGLIFPTEITWNLLETERNEKNELIQELLDKESKLLIHLQKHPSDLTASNKLAITQGELSKLNFGG